MGRTLEPMTTGSIWKRLVAFAVPILIGNLFQQLYNTVDSLIVGNYLGSRSLAAVSSSGSLIYMLVGFLGGIAAGAGVVVAKRYGAKDNEGLQKAVHTTFAFGLVAGIVMTAVGVLFSPQILRWMGTPDTVMAESVLYLRVFFMGSMGNVMYNICVGILQAVGDSRHPLYYLMISSVVNLVLDIVFIAYMHMGVDGAAIATVISQFLSAILCIIQLLLTKDVYRLNLRKIRFDMDYLREIIQIGLPSGVQNSIIAFANIVVQSNINAFGEMAMAGVGAYSKIEGFGFLPINSFTLAITTFVGQNIGAEEYDRARKGARFGIISTVVLAEMVGIVVFIFAPQFIAAFDSTPEVLAFGIAKARTSALFYCLLAFSHAVGAVMRGAGKATVPMVVMMVCWCFIRVAFLSIAVPLTHDINMVYIVYPMTWTLSTITFAFYYKKAHWLKG